MDREPRFHGEVSEERHKIMSRIRGKDTKPEIILRKYLWSKGLRYRKTCKGLPGKPDIALTKFKVAVFCDSEFWHGYDWEKHKNDKIVMVKGTFDLFHIGHLNLLKKSKALGDVLVVVLKCDEAVKLKSTDNSVLLSR